MSRARPITIPGFDTYWFDTNKNGQKATDEQLELLATLEGKDLDDMLDEVLTQGEVLRRLRAGLGKMPIPPEILLRRQKWRESRQVQPKCRICKKEGDSTKHHFVNKWILRELTHYASKWADRSKNCIPVCIDCHRDLHERGDEAKSIAGYLKDDERRFAHRAISALLHERPSVFELLVHGDPHVYEARLAKDWCDGRFIVPDPPERHLRVVA